MKEGKLIIETNQNVNLDILLFRLFFYKRFFTMDSLLMLKVMSIYFRMNLTGINLAYHQINPRSFLGLEQIAYGI